MLGQKLAERQARPFPKRMIAGGLIVLLAAIGIISYVQSRTKNAADSTYLTATVSRGDVATVVSATGPIAPARSVSLDFKNAGQIAEILVRPDDQVKAGQIVAREDPVDLQAALAQAQASLAQAMANETTLRTGASAADRNVARVAIDNARKAASDARRLASANQASAVEDVGVAQSGLATAQTNLSAAKQALTKTQEQATKALAADQSAIASAQKTLDAEKAAVASTIVVLQNLLEKAKDDLWSGQTNRDAICGRSDRATCQQADATVGTAKTGVATASAQLDQGKKQGAVQIAQAESQLQQARSQLANDQAHWDSAISSARSQVEQAQKALTTAQRNLADSQAKATATAASSQSSVDQAGGAVSAAQAAYDQKIEPPDQARLDAAQAQVTSARAAVAVAQANLDAASLKAPFDGTVAVVNGTVGQWTGAGSNGQGGSSVTGLIDIDDLEHLNIVAQVNEADMANVKVGDHVDFTVNAFRGQTFTGKVSAIQQQGTASQNIVQYAVTIAVDPTSARLLPGMTANVKIAVARQANVVVVPVAAITFAQSLGQSKEGNSIGSASAETDPAKGNAATVLVVTKGAATPRPIQVGLSDGRLAEVVSGLQVGEVVAVGTTPRGG